MITTEDFERVVQHLQKNGNYKFAVMKDAATMQLSPGHHLMTLGQCLEYLADRIDYCILKLEEAEDKKEKRKK